MSTAGTTGQPDAGQKPPLARIAVIGLLSAGVVVALYVAGRAHTADPAFSLFGRRYLAARSLTEGRTGHRRDRGGDRPGAAGALDVPAAAVWRHAPAGRPTRAPRTGLLPFALTVPIALHCLVAYAVQLTPVRVAVHSLAGCFL